MPPEKIKPVYVLYGSDSFLRDEYRRGLLSRIIGDADPQMAVSAFDATAELATVLDELRTTPLLAERRAVIVADADAFISAYRDPLERYVQAPSRHSSLILTVSTWAKSTRLYKLVEKVGTAIDCNAPNASGLAAWIPKAAGKRGKKIDPDAIDLLIQWVGEDLAALNSELEKLSLYVEPRRSITVDDVGALVAATAGPAAFALTNAITAGNPAGALKALGGSLTRRGEEFKVVGALAWHLRRALAVGQQLAAGQQPTLRMPSSQRGAFLTMVKRRGRERLQQDFRRLLAADLAMKSGTDALPALQELLIGLCT